MDESSGGPSRRSPNNAESSNGNALALEQEEFQPGAIVRVSVRNFVTYEKADFFPGPNLNMVIGPNGTGKSSLVCAICLGLGYSPKHLGRAGSVKEFVKHGKDTATIEIELQKQSRDRANYVIRVQILREQNKQKWWLNGKETTHKKIQALMRQLRIQVDNLCQFLPQDRVVEFAASTPVDLLHETLRAAAPEEMQEWHIQLQEKHKDRRELAETSRGDEETLQRLQNRQQGLQADVDRLREREQIQERVKNLRGALVMSKYEQARRNNSEAKERKKIAERSLRRLQEESGPSLEAVNRKQIYADKIESVIPSKVASYQDAIRAGQNVTRGISKAAEDIQGLENKIGAERKGFDEKKKEVAASRSKITSLQADMRSQPSDFNATEWNQKIVSIHLYIIDLCSNNSLPACRRT